MHSPTPCVIGIGEILWDMLPGGRRLGGAPANVVFHASQLGADSAMVSAVGVDAAGSDLLDSLTALGFDTTTIIRDSIHPTGSVDVIIDGNGIPSYTILESAAWDYLDFTPAMRSLAARADAVCYGTLAQRSNDSRATIRDFLDATRPDCLRVFDLNLRQEDIDGAVLDELFTRSSVVKLNDAELETISVIVGITGNIEDRLRWLADRYELTAVAMTRGSSGSMLLAGGAVTDHPGYPVDVVDSVGAGDAFTAAVITGILGGMPLDAINECANRIAAFVCSQPGGTPELPDELTAPFRGFFLG